MLYLHFVHIFAVMAVEARNSATREDEVAHYKLSPSSSFSCLLSERRLGLLLRPGALGTPTPPTPWSTPGNSPTSDEETFSRSLSTSVSGSSVWDRLSGGRANLFTKRDDDDDDDDEDLGADDRDRFLPPRRSHYVDLDDPNLRDDYNPAEDAYGSVFGRDFGFEGRPGLGSRRGRRDDEDDEGDEEDPHRILSTVRMAGTDLRSKLEKLRQSKSAPERMNPLRISVSNEAP